MYTIPLLCFAAAAFVAPEVVHSEDACATITANIISTVPFQEGYNATLTFTISNNCTGSDMWVKTFKVLTETDGSVATPMCQILFNNTVHVFASGCTYDHITHSGTITKHIDGYQDENWTLLAILRNGNIFNTTVDISANYSSLSASRPPVLTITASVGAVIVFFSIIIVVCGVRRKFRGAAQDTPNVQSESTGDTYYLHAISQPAEQRRSQPAGVSVQTQTLRALTGEDEYGYTMSDGPHPALSRHVAINEPRKTVSRRISTKDTGASSDMSIIDEREYRNDDDGYVLVDPDDTKADGGRPQGANSNRGIARPQKQHSPKYDDDGYMLPDSTGTSEIHCGTSGPEYQN